MSKTNAPAGGKSRKDTPPREAGDKKPRVDPSRETYERAKAELFPDWTYEEYFAWADKMNELIISCETALKNPNCKTIEITHTDPKTGKKTRQLFTKAEYAKYKRDTENPPPNAVCENCKLRRGKVCVTDRFPPHTIPHTPLSKPIRCTYYQPMEEMKL